MKNSDKKWHSKLQQLCNYKKQKKVLDMQYGPIVTEETLNRWKNQEINID